MESLRGRVEAWIRERTPLAGLPWTQPPAFRLPQWRWPPWRGRKREEERRAREEFERRRQMQLQDLCRAVKVESVAELQDLLCCLVLSECVYKRPATEMARFINKFKSDFGGQIVPLERVQPSLDHVPHRYILAEAGDTLFASFIGTKQYKDVIADVNIFQGVIFHEDIDEDFVESVQVGSNKKTEKTIGEPLQTKANKLINKSKPAAHRGFLARAKGIPALELYKLAQRKNRKLVLCGHSLGGAVAVLATLAILRVLVSSPPSKDQEEVQVRCITFSQPPVGNAALRDYVHQKEWQHYFKSYCIPEDLVPRILSPAYFHHYNAQTAQVAPDTNRTITSHEGPERSCTGTPKNNDDQQLVLGLGPVRRSVWRLCKLVPLESVQKHFSIFKRVGNETRAASPSPTPQSTLGIYETDTEPQSLEIRESPDGVSLNLLPDTERGPTEISNIQIHEKKAEVRKSRRWQRLPYLPSYVPFGQLFLLENSSVESLSDVEYSKRTSRHLQVRSAFAELKEQFNLHSMKSYRSRFQKIYDLCMSVNPSSFSGIDQLQQFPHLQQWLGLAAAGAVQLGHIVDPPLIHTATSIVPLGWTGVPGSKDSEPLKVDVIGHGLHLCTFLQARVNGKWCSTAVESFPSRPSYFLDHNMEPDLQKMRIIIGSPLKQQPTYSVADNSSPPMFSSPVSECITSTPKYEVGSFSEGRSVGIKGLDDFVIYCTNDFITVSAEVYIRTRRVRFLGVEGSGKTSLFNAIIYHRGQRNTVNYENELPQLNTQEAVVGGLCYLDSPGVNLEELQLEDTRFREELQIGVCDLSKKTDLIILVHNLSHKIPLYHQTSSSQAQPALSLVLDNAKAFGIPWVLAITNKFSISAHCQKQLINYVMESYQAPPKMTEVINSCPFVMPTAPLSSDAEDEKLSKMVATARTILSPIKLPFQKKPVTMPVEGVSALSRLVHRVLRSYEEMAFQELAEKRLSLQLAAEQQMARDVTQDTKGKDSMTAAAVGASLGAGLGLVMALVMGAASALRKP